nr:hypothetical protein [uncultured bacterium]
MRHSNGHGRVADQAEARPLAFVDVNSQVMDEARIHSGSLISSTLGVKARFSNAIAMGCVISCDEVTGGHLVECGLFDQVCVWDSPQLYRVQANDGARVYGSAVLIGPMRLYGDMRIMAGTWHREPRYVHLGHCFMTEGPPGWAMVDCKFLSYERWFRSGPRFAAHHYGWNEEQIDAVRQVLIEWSSTEDLRFKHWGACVPACYGRGPS